MSYSMPINNVPSNTGSPMRYASFQHRLGALALDIVLLNATFFIGWIIWSLVIWGNGQTPAKQILKIRVHNSVNGRPASWGQMAIREGLLGWWFLLFWMYVFLLFTPLFFVAILVPIAGVAWFILEIVFYFTKNNRTLRDLWVKTAVVNEA